MEYGPEREIVLQIHVQPNLSSMIAEECFDRYWCATLKTQLYFIHHPVVVWVFSQINLIVLAGKLRFKTYAYGKEI